MIEDDTPTRATFEAWAAEPCRAAKLPLDRWPLNNGYQDDRTYSVWYGWKFASLHAAKPEAQRQAGQESAAFDAQAEQISRMQEVIDCLVEQKAAYAEAWSAMLAAPPAAPVPAWISVKDRLPLEGDGTVAVLMDDGSILTAWATYWHGASDKFAQWTHPFDVDDAQVAYWCPIPEPMAF